MYRSTKVKSLYIRSKHFTFFFIIFEFEEQDPIEEDASILQCLQFVQMYCSTKVTHSKHSSFFFIIFEFEEQDPIEEDASILQHSILQFLKLYIRNIRHFSSLLSNSRSRIQSKKMFQIFNILFYNSYKYIVKQTLNQ